MPAIATQLDARFLIRAIENEPENVVGGLLVAFTDSNQRDAFGQYFSRATDFGLDLLGDNAQRPLSYEHNRTSVQQPIGVIRSIEVQEEGLFAISELDDTSPLYPVVLDQVNRGELGYSAETTPPYFRYNQSGHIDRFAIFGATLSRAASAPEKLTQVGLLRGLGLTDEQIGVAPDTPDDSIVNAVMRSVWYLDVAPEPPTQRTTTPRHITIPFSGMPRPLGTERLPDPTQRANIPLQGGNISGMRHPTDDFSLMALLDWYRMSRAALATKPYDIEYPDDDKEGFMRAIMTRTIEAFQKDEQSDNPQYFQRIPYYDKARSEWKYTESSWDILSRHVSRATKKDYNTAQLMRADEVVHTANSGVGDGLIITAHSMELWRNIRLQTRVFSLFPSFIMPSKTFQYHRLANPGYARRVTETTDKSELSIGASPYVFTTPAEDEVTFSIVDKFGTIIPWSDEFRRFENIAFMEAYRQYLFEMLWRTADRIVLHGDETDTNANISYGGGAGNSPTVDGLDWLILADGLIHHCLIGNGSYTDNASAALTLGMFDAGRTALDPLGLDPENVVHIANSTVGHGARQLAELETVDKFGSQATVLKGQVQTVKGAPLIIPEDYGKTDVNGIIHQTGGNNTLSSILTVDRRTVMIGVEWEASIEHIRAAWSDAEGLKGRAGFDIQVMQDNGVDYQYDTTGIPA